MRKAALYPVLALLGLALLPAPANAASNDFSRAIAYYLADDTDLARKSLDAHFNLRPQPTLKQGFALLFAGEKWEATKKFRDYLESNHRSLEALTGISLATADIKNDLAIENLGKVLRLDPGYAPAYLCLGHEYFLRGNHPAAEEYYAKSLKYAPLPEFKILLAEFYLKTGQAKKALDLVGPEAGAAPRLYHYAIQAAQAAMNLGDLAMASSFLDQAQSARPDSKDAQLLRGRLLMASGDLRRAKSQLAQLKFNRYNPEYSLAMAEILLRLKDRDAEKYLYEVFAQDPWHPGINRLLGLHHLKGNKASVQNWLERALLSGMAAAELQREFAGPYRFPNYSSFPVFDARKIQWLGNGRLLVAGALRSGEKEKLTILDAASLKTIKSFEYEGSIQDIFPAARLDKVIFSTTAAEGEKVYLYTLVAERDTYKLKPVVGYALDMAAVQVGFSENGATAYVTDANWNELAFTSPFSVVTGIGRKTALYPDHPIAVFSYTYAGERWTQIRSRDALRSVPLPFVRRFLTVADAYRDDPGVAKLLDRGSKLEITSDEEMKIHFGASDRHFLISFSDLKNAFRAWAYDPRAAQLAQFDETMFLGAKYYAELDIHLFNPAKGEILVTTRDKQRNLVQFNYKSLLYKKLASNALVAAVQADGNTVYVLSERNRQLYYSETNLEVFQLSPFNRSKIGGRNDLNAIVDCSDRSRQYFSTYNGEMVKLDEDGKFSRRQVSLTGALHQVAPDKKKAAAFINGRLFVLPWQE